MVNRSIVLAGLFTVLGALYGSQEHEAKALVLEPTVIESVPPTDACTEFELDDDGSVTCHDTGETFDVDHYIVLRDTDTPDWYYLVTWRD